ncbi:hypothetical protein [Vibrio splendidus]|uniref:hypothetical protein n=1 Tax=Vibrio splendidus TaxID=29497 RepID=UPI0006C9EA8D|nr:hypothetical protein [Vibrio splendidus]KPL99867.1 hypothetical protein AN167_10540 [Vibrio splendidus]
MRHIITLALFCISIGASAQGVDTYQLEKRIGKIDAQIEELEDANSVLQFFHPNIELLGTQLQNSNYNTNSLFSSLKDIKKTLSHIESGELGDVSLSEIRLKSNLFEDRMEDAMNHELIYESWTDRLRENYTFLSIYNSERFHKRYTAEAVGNSIKAIFSTSEELDTVKEHLSIIDEALREARYFLKEQAREQAEIEYISDGIISIDYILEHFKKQQQSASKKLLLKINTLVDKLKSDLTRNNETLSKLVTERKNLNSSLQSAITKKSALDNSLSIAIYMMIIVLFLMFFLLRFFQADEIKELIQHRTLIEIVSIAFILLTIIILGTGERIGTETLGTLLGTIAGYIFARRPTPNSNPKE